MILSIAGVASGNDISSSLDRGSFELEAAVGKRMDTTRFTLFDPSLIYGIPDRAEMWIYDAVSAGLAYKAAVLADNPVAYWRLDDIAGSSALDTTGNGHTGTIAGGVTKGVGGATPDGNAAMQFNGSTGIITVPDDPAFAFGLGSFSYECWYRWVSGFGPIFKGGASASNKGFDIENGSDGSSINAGLSDGTTRYAAVAGMSARDGKYHHVVVVVDRAAQLLRLYVDGIQRGSPVDITACGTITNTSAFQIGRIGTVNWTACTVDEVAIYASALSAARVAAHFGALPPITDPPNAISAYNTYINGKGKEVTSSTPANWTPRLFAGYCADIAYQIEGAQRTVDVSAQDYTVRLRTTVGNFAFAQGQTDQSIIQTLFTKYWPEIDTTNVAQIATGFPAISFPIHTLEQCMERIIKVSRAIYRVDYYKRLFYGALGQQSAPFNLSDTPNGTTTFGYEGMRYSPYGSGLANKVWIVGSSFLSKLQSFQVPLQLVNGTNWQFGVPGNPELNGLKVTVGGVDQGTVGVTPGDGDIGSQTGWRAGVNVLIQHVPAIVALRTTPVNGAVVIITGQFRYPLTTAVSDPLAIAATGGKIFEAIVRDRRVADLTLAQQIGNAFLKNQGVTLKGGSCLINRRLIGSSLIQPGQQITITGVRLFTGLLAGGVTTFTALITKLTMKLTEDTVEPYDITLEFADRQVGMTA